MPDNSNEMRKPAEQWASEKHTPAWLLAAMRAHEQWPLGRDLTEGEFDEACRVVGQHRLGY